MRASSRGTRDDDSVTSGGGSPAPPLFVETNRGRFSGAATSGIGRRRNIAASIGARDAAGLETAAQHPDVRRAPQSDGIKSEMSRVANPIKSAFLCLAVLSLPSCSSVHVGDFIPHAIGGLPADAPPRRGTPEYDAWMAKRAEEAARPKTEQQPK